MIYCCHRINTSEELLKIPTEYGIEVDVRDFGADLVLAHDPFCGGEKLDNFLSNFSHKFIILNVKSERIEYSILKLLNKYSIKNYSFLDSSFPMMNKLSNEGVKNQFVRYSEFEPLQFLKRMAGRVDWVWADCFNKMPLNKMNFKQIKKCGYKVCIVSPELQNQEWKILEYGEKLNDNNVKPDMVCCKLANIEKWEKILN
jgi:hypothetical protein